MGRRKKNMIEPKALRSAQTAEEESLSRELSLHPDELRYVVDHWRIATGSGCAVP